MGKRPWDDLYNPKKINNIEEEIIPDIPKEVEIEIRDYQKDATAIGKRIAYGLVVYYLCIQIYIYYFINYF
jgi:hypothetical protein